MLTVALTPSMTETGLQIHARYANYVLSGAPSIGETVCPVVLPPTSDQALLGAYASMFDAYLFTGGGDVDPAYYGEERHPLCGEPNAARDEFEIALLHELIRQRRPVFGICRGIQMMNVALGGTLWQDLGSQLTVEPHLSNPERTHAVYVSGPLEALLGNTEILTNSWHHQAVNIPGEGLRVLARSQDGVIEAVAHESLPFYRAVQWHPEMHPEDEISKKLIAAFLAAARDNKA
jgi:putative glutamine amidotransferase